MARGKFYSAAQKTTKGCVLVEVLGNKARHACGKALKLQEGSMLENIQSKKVFAARMGFGIKEDGKPARNSYNNKCYFQVDESFIFFKKDGIKDMLAMVNFFGNYVLKGSEFDEDVIKFRKGLMKIYYHDLDEITPDLAYLLESESKRRFTIMVDQGSNYYIKEALKGITTAKFDIEFKYTERMDNYSGGCLEMNLPLYDASEANEFYERVLLQMIYFVRKMPEK